MENKIESVYQDFQKRIAEDKLTTKEINLLCFTILHQTFESENNKNILSSLGFELDKLKGLTLVDAVFALSTVLLVSNNEFDEQ